MTVNETVYESECFNDVDNLNLEITKAYLPPIEERTNISITVESIRNPVTVNTPTQSFNLTSFEDELFEFPLERVSGNLIPQTLKCKQPCATCASPKELSTCTSCFNLPTIKERFLNGTTCLAACPSGFFADGFTC